MQYDVHCTDAELLDLTFDLAGAARSGDEEEAEPSKKKTKQEIPKVQQDAIHCQLPCVEVCWDEDIIHQGSFEVYVHHKLMVSCTEVAWLPSLLHLPTGEKIAVVSMATRTGHVILWGLQVPVVKGRYVCVSITYHCHCLMVIVFCLLQPPKLTAAESPSATAP